LHDVHREEAEIPVDVQFVEPDQVGVDDVAQGAVLGLEPLAQLRRGVLDRLQREVLLPPLVEGPVDDAERTGPEDLADPVPLPCVEG
jgi:hypothetical protein